MTNQVETKPVISDNVAKILDAALDAGEGLLRLTPTWVPRSFLHPGKRIRLHPDDYYAMGAERGGIDERWFASTTDAANENRVWHEGLSFCTFEGELFLLKDAVAAKAGAAWDKAEDIAGSVADKVGDAGEAIGDKLTGGDDSETT